MSTGALTPQGMQETSSGLFREIVRNHQRTPWRNTRIFRTATDGQKDMVIRIFEGASFRTKNNIYIGEVVIPDLPPGPRGSVEVEVRFEAYVSNRIHCRFGVESNGLLVTCDD